MAKTKAEGMLCTDKARNEIAFFVGATRRGMVFLDGCWYMRSGRFFEFETWTLEKFNALYTITENGKVIGPPKPGHCFAVEIEL